MPNWTDTPVDLTRLQALAEQPGWGVAMPAFEFLKEVGVVPANVMSMPAEKVKLTLDRKAIPAGYLASAAYEWDTWGPSHPSDFVDAINTELDPAKRDLIGSVLTELGRSFR
jgi:hypothetical protein